MATFAEKKSLSSARTNWVCLQNHEENNASGFQGQATGEALVRTKGIESFFVFVLMCARRHRILGMCLAIDELRCDCSEYEMLFASVYVRTYLNLICGWI